MDLEDENPDCSVTGSMLRLAATAMFISAAVVVLKGVSGGWAAGDILAGAFAGVMGTAVMIGAAAADCRCMETEDEDGPGREAAKVLSVAMAAPEIQSAVIETSEQCERRFTARLQRERNRNLGKGM